MNPLQQLLNRLRAFWAGQSLTRRLMFGVLALLIVAVAVASSGVATPYKYVPLFSDPLPPEEVGAIAAKLKAGNKTYRLNETGTLEVPSTELAATRVALAAEGVPARGKGFELFDESQFAVPPDVQRINYLRALQGELARSIQQIDAVQAARVHIALPPPTPFVREQKPTTGSVIVTLKPGRSLNQNQAAGIVGLVSKAVEGLKPENVTVVDSKTGHQLYRHRPPEQEGLPAGQLEYQMELEKYLAAKAQDLLTAHLGPGRAAVTVRTEIDFTKLRERSRQYQSPGVVAAERNMTSKATGGGGARGVAGAASNVRTAGGTTGGGPGSTSNEETTAADYLVPIVERDRENSMQGVTRLSIAAIVDLRPQDGENPRPTISAADAEAIIRQAVGFKQGRDDIQVSNQPLGQPVAEPEAPPEPGILDQTAVIVTLVRNGALALTALVILALLATVVLRRRRPPPPETPPPPAPPTAEELERAAEERRRAELEQFIELARRDPDMVAEMLLRMLEEEPAETP
jgi:flagellar M-ring protein FliF